MAITYPYPAAFGTTAGGGVIVRGNLVLAAVGRVPGSGHGGLAIYKIPYEFDGFFRPVRNEALNKAKAGSSLPIKFSLSGDFGLDIFGAGYPQSVQIDCQTGAESGTSSPAETAGKSSLQYDADRDQYSYVWKTEKGWSGTCRQFQLPLDDGTLHTADFKFK